MSTHRLHELGHRLWLHNTTRELLDGGPLAHYIHDCSITGLTSNPGIFDAALSTSDVYDNEIAVRSASGLAGESLFIHIALRDLCRAADMFRPLFDASDGQDGWVSMEISPLRALKLQSDDIHAFVRSWYSLLARITLLTGLLQEPRQS